MAVLCLAAAVAVILVIWGIRLTHKDPGSGGPTVPPSSTTTTRPATSHIAPTAFVAPLNNAQLAQYEQYATGLRTANGVAAKGFVGAGSTSTSTQLAPVAAAYRTAVNLYDFQLRFIQWPASMQPAIQVDHAQLEALVSLLTSYPRSALRVRVPGSPNCTTRPARRRPRTTRSVRTSGCPKSPRFPNLPPSGDVQHPGQRSPPRGTTSRRDPRRFTDWSLSVRVGRSDLVERAMHVLSDHQDPSRSGF